MARRRRAIEVFTLSFLDCICCGFGAVILFYTIVSAQAGVVRIQKADDMSSQVNRLAEQVIEGANHLAALRSALERAQAEAASTSGRSSQIVAELRSRDEDVSTFDAQNLAR